MYIRPYELEIFFGERGDVIAHPKNVSEAWRSEIKEIAKDIYPHHKNVQSNLGNSHFCTDRSRGHNQDMCYCTCLYILSQKILLGKLKGDNHWHTLVIKT